LLTGERISIAVTSSSVSVARISTAYRRSGISRSAAISTGAGVITAAVSAAGPVGGCGCQTPTSGRMPTGFVTSTISYVTRGVIRAM